MKSSVVFIEISFIFVIFNAFVTCDEGVKLKQSGTKLKREDSKNSTDAAFRPKEPLEALLVTAAGMTPAPGGKKSTLLIDSSTKRKYELDFNGIMEKVKRKFEHFNVLPIEKKKEDDKAATSEKELEVVTEETTTSVTVQEQTSKSPLYDNELPQSKYAYNFSDDQIFSGDGELIEVTDEDVKDFKDTNSYTNYSITDWLHLFAREIYHAVKDNVKELIENLITEPDIDTKEQDLENQLHSKDLLQDLED